MIETKEKEINGNVYSVTQLPARRALRLKAKLIKTFGPALTQLILTYREDDKKPIDKMTDEEKEREILFSQASPIDIYRIHDLKKSALVKAIQILSSAIDEKTFDEFCLEILQGCRRNGVEMIASNIDMDFAGNLSTLYEVIFFVLEVNYADFFIQSDTGYQLKEISPLPEVDTKKTYTFKSKKNSLSGA